MARRALPPPLRDALKTAGEEGYLLSSERPSSLRPEQFYRYYPNRHVKSVFWSVTGRCNFRCRRCYMDAPDAALGELSTGQALRLIDEMAECGVLRVDLTGGEALVLLHHAGGAAAALSAHDRQPPAELLSPGAGHRAEKGAERQPVYAVCRQPGPGSAGPKRRVRGLRPPDVRLLEGRV